MSLKPYEVLIRFKPEGAFQGASIKYWDEARQIETAPQDLGDTSDPRFQEVLGAAIVAANAQITELQAQLTTATADAAELPTLRDRITQLETELNESQSQVSTLQAQLATAQVDAAEVPTLRDRIIQLDAELEGYRNPPRPRHDYVGLWNSFLREGINIFLFVRYMADQTLPIANAYSDFKDALTSPTPSLAGLQSSVNNLFMTIRAFGADFDKEQNLAMRSLLDSYGFEEINFPLQTAFPAGSASEI